jgi:hypothetical protein
LEIEELKRLLESQTVSKDSKEENEIIDEMNSQLRETQEKLDEIKEKYD